MPSKLAIGRRDAAIARIAANQHGVVTTTQLEGNGFARSGIADRVRAGRLFPVHRAVYAVGHCSLSKEGRWMAAVLAYGDAAVLSHRSAAALWGILPRGRRHNDLSGTGPIDVTVPGHGGRSKRRGIRLHRSKTLLHCQCTMHRGIPVTNPTRTLEDFREVARQAEYTAAVREAEFLHLSVDAEPETDRTRTELEALFLGVCRRHRLSQPEVNVHLDRYAVDFLWRAHRLVVEVDGWHAHRMRSAFEEDRARDTRLKLLGYEVLRFTWRQVEDEPRVVAQTVRTLLQR